MLVGLLSDPHANLPALEAVLADVGRVRPDVLVCLGDFVGYGAQPNEVVDALRDRCAVSLAGNHDLAALGAADLSTFNRFAAASAVWTREQLDPSAVSFLTGLPSRGSIGELELAHASLRDPVGEYVIDSFVAAANFEVHPFLQAAVGHTHVAALFVHVGESVMRAALTAGEPFGAKELEKLGGPVRVLLNPGGIGQPRDGDPRAAWGLWDAERRAFSVRRVEYAIEAAQEAIRAAGLPGLLADRLAEGW